MVTSRSRQGVHLQRAAATFAVAAIPFHLLLFMLIFSALTGIIPGVYHCLRGVLLSTMDAAEVRI